MKELYKPVFWCGFALSLSALYASSERVTAEVEPGSKKPVLMQINIGAATNEKVDSSVVERNEMIAGEVFIEPPVVADEPISIGSDEEFPETIEKPAGTSVFLSDAQKFLGNR